MFSIAHDDKQIRRIYLQLTSLGLLLHLVQTIIFYKLSCPMPALYNIASVFFYALMLYVIYRHMYRMAVSAIHVETCLFALCCTIFCGWGTGIPLYLLAMSSLVYFCPFRNKLVPYLFSLAELIVFTFLRIFTYYHEPVYGHFSKSTELIYFIFNSLACFYIILFASYSSNISATVTNKRLRSENKNLNEIANSDLLTALPNRHGLIQHISRLPANTQITVAIGDLDDFKKINDSLGHNSGDYVLRTIGQLINDACPPHSLPCRWGGEEFVILFDCPLADAISHLEHLRRRISDYHFEYESRDIHITITFGAYSGRLQDGIDTLIDEADKYLYQGKQNGKNCISSPFTLH